MNVHQVLELVRSPPFVAGWLCLWAGFTVGWVTGTWRAHKRTMRMLRELGNMYEGK